MTDTEKKFTGQRLDGTGLYYYGARYYDPSIGRFISPYPITHSWPLPMGQTFEALTVSSSGPWAKGRGNEPNTGSAPVTVDPQEHNRYTYGLNNPLRYVDPTGNQVELFVVGGIIATAIVVAVVGSYFGQPVRVDYQAIWEDVSNTLDNVRKNVSSAWNRIKNAVGLGVANYADATPRKLADRWESLKNNPDEWELVESESEAATGKAYKGGTSVRETFRNKVTGETIERHRIHDKKGNMKHEHPAEVDDSEQ